jgi:hypothetical protein
MFTPTVKERHVIFVPKQERIIHVNHVEEDFASEIKLKKAIEKKTAVADLIEHLWLYVTTGVQSS